MPRIPYLLWLQLFVLIVTVLRFCILLFFHPLTAWNAAWLVVLVIVMIASALAAIHFKRTGQ